MKTIKSNNPFNNMGLTHKLVCLLTRIKQRTIYEANSIISITLFNTKKHSYTVGDMITLTSFMILLTGFVFISLMVGIR